MASLQVTSGLNAGQTFELAEREVTVGRDVTCSVVLPYRTVSRLHARILRMPDGYYIEDVQSVNGTAVNGKRLDRRTRLTHSDRIRIHDIVLAFLEEDRENDSTHVVTLRPPATHDGAAGRDGAGTATAVKPASKAEKTVADRIYSTLDARSGAEQRLEVNAHQKLRAVLEITQNLGSSLDTDAVLPKILESLFRIFPQTDRGYVLQLESKTGELLPKAIKQRGEESDTISPISGTVAARVISERAAFLSGDAGNDERLEEMNSSIFETVRSVMCAPLMGSSHVPVGVIHVETSDARRVFTPQDLEVLVSVAFLAGQAVDYAKMHDKLLDLDRQKRDLAMAKEVQLHFLPGRRPEVQGYKFFDLYRPAEEVAGDYYDYIELPSGKLAVIVADVAGKGVSAALMMARLCSDVRYALLTTPSPSEALRRLNEELCNQRGEGTFVTMVICLLDPVEHKLTVASAGHAPPMLRCGETGGVQTVAEEASGLPLGVNRAAHYDEATLPLGSRDMVVCFTDGVNEAMNNADQTYGFDAVREVIARAPSDCQHAGQALMADVRTFTEGRLQSDDICLLCFSRCD
jgi:sigma-B regulation protein RsbU (phosphoserine phosphatase)